MKAEDRVAFEKSYCGDFRWDSLDDCYYDPDTNNAWLLWQACERQKEPKRDSRKELAKHQWQPIETAPTKGGNTMILNFDSREYLKGNITPFKVGVFGSRTLKDERVKTIILEKIKELNATKILTCQEPQGVSEVAQRISKDYGYPLQLHFLNMQYLRGAFEQRSKEIIADGDYFIIIHDGKSKGTANEKKLVEKSGKPYHYEILEPTKYDRSVGFNIKDDWDFKTNDDTLDIDGLLDCF